MAKDLHIDVRLDLSCDICARSRSTDFDLGMELREDVPTSVLRRMAKQEGWVFDDRGNVCPICAKLPRE